MILVDCDNMKKSLKASFVHSSVLLKPTWQVSSSHHIGLPIASSISLMVYRWSPVRYSTGGTAGKYKGSFFEATVVPQPAPEESLPLEEEAEAEAEVEVEVQAEAEVEVEMEVEVEVEVEVGVGAVLDVLYRSYNALPQLIKLCAFQLVEQRKIVSELLKPLSPQRS
jgi:hypothetical protein